MRGLKDRIAVVTGAGGGIGRKICRRSVEEGVNIVAVDLNASVKKPLDKSASRAASTCIAVAITFLSLLTGAAGAATAQELFIHELAILAGDLASWQRDQAKPAGRSNPQARGAPGMTAPRFDVTTMLPIESIDAQTSVTVLRRDRAPDELQLAALRRAWTADPAIRGFRGGPRAG